MTCTLKVLNVHIFVDQSTITPHNSKMLTTLQKLH